MHTLSNSIVVFLPLRLEFRDAMGAMVHSLCSSLEQGGKARAGTANEVLSAFNEAFNNLVLHGPLEGRCSFVLELLQHQLILRMVDFGPGFDLEAQPEPDLSDASEPASGGYGLYIMRAYMTAVEYLRGGPEKGNVLTMIRELGGDT